MGINGNNFLFLSSIAFILFLTGNLFSQKTDIEIAAEKFFRSPQYSDVQLSPDGNNLSYLSPSPNFKLFIYNLTTKESKLMGGKTIGENAQSLLGNNPFRMFTRLKQDIIAHTWIDNKYLLFRVSGQDYYDFGLWRTDKNFENVKRLATDGSSSKFYTVLDPLVSKDKKCLVGIKMKGEEYSSVYELDVVYKDEDLVAENNGKVYKWEADLDGVVRLKSEIDSLRRRYYLRDSVDDNWEELVLPENCSPICFFTNNSLIVSDGLNQNTYGMSLYEISSKKLTRNIFRDEIYDYLSYKNINLIRSSNDNKIIGIELLSNRPKMFYFGKYFKDAGKTVKAIMPETINTIMGIISGDSSKVLVKSYSDIYPIFYSVFDLDKNDYEIIAQSQSWINPSELNKVIPITFPGRDGKGIHGYFSKPANYI